MPSLFFPLFFSFSASFKNSGQEKRSENCLRLETGAPSLCLYPLLSREKKFWGIDLLMQCYQRALSGF